MFLKSQIKQCIQSKIFLPYNNHRQMFWPRIGRNLNRQQQQNLQEFILPASLNQSLRPLSDNAQRQFYRQQSQRPFHTVNQPRMNYSEVILYSQNLRNENRNRNLPRVGESFEVREIDFVDSLELYSRNNRNLRNRVEIISNERRLNSQSQSISLNSSESLFRIQPECSISYNNTRNRSVNFSFGHRNPLQQNHQPYQQFSSQSQQQPYFPSSNNQNNDPHFYSHSHQLPFIVDIQSIQRNQNLVTQQVNQLELQHKEIQLDIQLKEKARQQDMEKWKKLNQMIDEYYCVGQEENPQGDYRTGFGEEQFKEDIDFLCPNKKNNQNIEENLQDVLERFVQIDIQNDQEHIYQGQLHQNQQPIDQASFQHNQ